jgi:hypothetical protein
MTYEEFQTVGRQMISDARDVFDRRAASLIAGQPEAQAFAAGLRAAIGEVSPYEALAALEQWIEEHQG